MCCRRTWAEKKQGGGRRQKGKKMKMNMNGPKMYHVRDDVKTSEQRAKLLYAWLLMGEKYMPEVTVMNKNYKGNNDRPGFIFGSDCMAKAYSWRNIPAFDEFAKALKENDEVCTCFASTDENDTERVGMFDLKGNMVLTVYADQMDFRHEAVFDRLDEIYDDLNV